MPNINTLEGNEVARMGDLHFQTFLNTHNGDNRLAPLQNSFISFTFGGKYIEDFGLNVVNLNDRRTVLASASFNDITTSYDVLDGEFYWGTKMNGYSLQLDMATDGMTERQIEDFKAWFKPGVIRGLRLSEHWGREICARISAPPDIRMIPFEFITTQSINGSEYDIKTTLYKGEISINFSMEESYWHNYFESFTDIDDMDSRKIMLEDGIPYKDMFSTNVGIIVGRGIDNQQLYDEWKISDEIEMRQALNRTIEISNGITIANNSAYLYYCGTAPSSPKLSFSLQPKITAFQGTNNIPKKSSVMIAFPSNSYVYKYSDTQNIVNKPYNCINIGDSQLKITTPSIWTGYMQAINLINTIVKANIPVENLRIAFMQNINNYEARAWALGCLAWVCANADSELVASTRSSNDVEKWITDNNTFCDGSGVAGVLQKLMRIFIIEPQQFNADSTILNNNAMLGNQAHFNLNFYMGEMIGTFTCRQFISSTTTGYTIDSQGNFSWDNILNSMKANPESGADDISWFSTNTKQNIITQNVGDMINSGHLIIQERKLFNDNGYITPNECQLIRLDNSGVNNAEITNLKIDYHYMYY